MKTKEAAVSVAVGSALLVAAVIGSELQELRNNQVPACFEDEAIVWSGATDSHSACVPIDHIVDRGIEVAIQNNVLQFVQRR